MDAHKVDGHVGGGVRPRVNELQRNRAIEKYIRAKQMMADGCSLSEAARQLDVVPATIYGWRRRYEEVS
jgi:transposase-like protein